MSRVAGIAEGRGGPIARIAYRLARRDYGRVPGPLKVYALEPRLLVGYGLFEYAFARSKSVDRRLKALAVIKASTVAACEYCLDIASWEAHEAGLSDEQLLALARYRDSDAFTELEKLVLDYATAMTRTPIDVPDELHAALRRELSDRQLVELTTAIALENMRARFNAALAIEPDGFAAGRVCAVAERPAAAAQTS